MSEGSLNLDAYLDRIGYQGPRAANLDVLRALHREHVKRVPFENLDVRLGRPIRLDLDSLQAKLVGGRRGGYCFEQNTLFAAVLRELGFRVTTLAARVRYMTTAMLPRTHMLLRVDLVEGPFIADVGFGGYGLTGPLRLLPGEEQSQHLDVFRFVEEGNAFGLQVRQNGQYIPLYAFTLEEHFPVDYEMANHFTSTHPSSRFVQMLVAARCDDDARYGLRDREFSIRKGDAVERRAIESQAELVATLARFFDLRVDTSAKLGVFES